MRRGAHRIALVFALLLVMFARPVHADDRVAELTKMLSSSSNDKVRLSAVAALARLGDKRALKPLVTALGDPNPQIRAVAAVALGRLGHKAALPALRSAANDDADPTVRTTARDAVLAVAKANNLPDGLTPPPAAEKPSSSARKGGGRAGFGNQPHAIDSHPDLYVTISTANDDSPGKADKKARLVHGDILRQTLADQCKRAVNVTTTAVDAQRWGLDQRNIDISVIKLDVASAGAFVEVDAQLRLAISDSKGKMLSFLSGGAKVSVPKKTFDAKYLPNMRREALENAMRGMFDKLIQHLRDRSQS